MFVSVYVEYHVFVHLLLQATTTTSTLQICDHIAIIADYDKM